MRKILSALAIVAFIAPQVRGQNYYVSPSGNDANDGLSLVTAKQTIAAAYAVAPPGATINIMPGDYTLPASLNIEKAGIKLLGNEGNLPRPNISGAAGVLSLIRANQPGIEIRNLNLRIDLTNNRYAIQATNDKNWDGIVVEDNVIESTLAGTYDISYPYTGTNSYGIQLQSPNNYMFTVKNNYVKPLALSGYKAVEFGIYVNGGYGIIEDNQVRSINGIFVGKSSSATTVKNNYLWPQISGIDVNWAKANVSVEGNFLFVGQIDFLAAEIVCRDNIEPGTTVSIVNNTLQGYQYYGVVVTRTENALVYNNVFTPAVTADYFTHLHLNTRYVVNASPTLYPPFNGTSVFIKGNLFNGPTSIDDGGTAIEIANFDTRCTFEDVVIGGAGSDANTFGNKLRYFLKMDPRTGDTDDLIINGIPIADISNPGSQTPVGPADFPVDLSQNLFGINEAPSGIYAPGALSQAQLFEIEDKIQHYIDWGALGYVNVKNNESFVTAVNDLDSLGAVPSVQRALNSIPVNGVVNVEPTTLFNETLTVDKDFTLDAADFVLIQNVTVDGGDVTLDGVLKVNNTLTLTDGLINAWGSDVYVVNSAPASIVGGSAASYVNGYLRRWVGTGDYAFPVGKTDYQLANFGFDAPAFDNVRVWFEEIPVAIGTLTNANCATIEYTAGLDNGKWRFYAYNGMSDYSGPADILFDLNPQGFTNGNVSFSAYVDGATSGACYASAYGDGTIGNIPTGGNVLTVVTGACGAPLTLTITPPAAVCAGSGTVQIVLDYAAVSYAWTGPNSFSSTDQSPFVNRVAANSGTYTVVATDAFGCTATGTVNVTINALPAEPVVVSPYFVCSPSATFAPSFDDNGDNQLRWYTSLSAPTPFSTANSLLIDEPVVYYISVYNTVTGCESARVEAQINVAPKPSFVGIENIAATQARPRWRKAPSWVSTVSFPYGKFELEFIRTNPSPETLWTVVSSSLADTSQLITGLSPLTTYQVRVRYECLDGWSAWSDTSVSTRFTTLALVCSTPGTPTTTAAGSGNRIINWGASGSAISYAVANGNVLHSPSTWPVTIVDAAFTTVTLTGLNPSINYRCRVLANCTSPYTNTVLTTGTSAWSSTSATYKPNARFAQNSSSNFEVSVFPNPNAGVFTLALAADVAGTAHIEVLDVTGRTIFKSNFDVEVGENSREIRLNQAAPGLYTVKCAFNGTTGYFKTVVE